MQILVLKRSSDLLLVAGRLERTHKSSLAAWEGVGTQAVINPLSSLEALVIHNDVAKCHRTHFLSSAKMEPLKDVMNGADFYFTHRIPAEAWGTTLLLRKVSQLPKTIRRTFNHQSAGVGFYDERLNDWWVFRSLGLLGEHSTTCVRTVSVFLASCNMDPNWLLMNTQCVIFTHCALKWQMAFKDVLSVEVAMSCRAAATCEQITDNVQVMIQNDRLG